MLGEQRGALIQLVGMQLLKRLRDAAVHRRTALTELGVVGDLLRQRMLERVHGVGVELLLIQELRGDQRPQSRLELAVAEHGRSLQNRLGELPSDHRGALQQALLALGEPVDPRREDSVDRRRDRGVVNRAYEPVGAALTGEVARFHERAYDLLDEERVASGPLGDQGGQTVQRRVAAEQVGEQHLDRLRPQRQQRDLPVVGLVHPLSAVLGAEVDDREVARPRYNLDELSEESLGPPVDPVHVLEQVDPGLALAAGMNQALDHLQQRPLARVRVHARRRAMRVGHGEEVEYQRQALSERLIEQQQPPGDLLTRLLVRVVLCHPEVAAHHLQDGKERDRAAVRLALSLIHRNALPSATLHELAA